MGMIAIRVPASLIAVAVVLAGLSGCAANPAQSDPGLPGAGTADVHTDPSGDIAHLAAVRLAGQDGYDRLVLEFTDRVPGYTVGTAPCRRTRTRPVSRSRCRAPEPCCNCR